MSNDLKQKIEKVLEIVEKDIIPKLNDVLEKLDDNEGKKKKRKHRHEIDSLPHVTFSLQHFEKLRNGNAETVEEAKNLVPNVSEKDLEEIIQLYKTAGLPVWEEPYPNGFTLSEEVQAMLVDESEDKDNETDNDSSEKDDKKEEDEKDENENSHIKEDEEQNSE